MHTRTIRSLAGYTLMIILISGSIMSSAAQCLVDKLNGRSRALCNKKGLKTVPQDLPTDIQILDFSENTNVETLDADSFKLYKQLTWLSLQNCQISSNIGSPYAGFKPLEILEELDISGLNHAGEERKYNFPSNLKVLKVNKTGVGDLVLTDLLKLEYVDASENLKMVTFPLFGKTARVQTVILNNVRLDHLDVIQIAPNCHITRLDMSIDVDGGSEILEPNKYCLCSNINRWANEFVNQSNLKSSPLQCRKPDPHKTYSEICSNDDDYKGAVRERYDCLVVANPGANWLLIFGGVLVLLLIVMATCVFILNIKVWRHTRHVHSVLEGRKKSDGEEEAKPEEQPEQPQPEQSLPEQPQPEPEESVQSEDKAQLNNNEQKV